MYHANQLLLSIGATAIFIGLASAQPPGAPDPPRTAQAAALFDITGYWIAVVTEDWRFRMVTPPRGDYTGVFLNAEGRKMAAAWDPARDEASGEQCKSYGAPNIMRVPGRIHIAWQDDQTLKIETDTGQQTRLLYFGAPRTPGGDWQGTSKATWDSVGGSRGQAPVGSLKVSTSNLKPGYLRKNGVPYSASALVTEYFDRADQPSGEAYLLVTTTVEDPIYLSQPFLAASHFRKQADATGWNPTPCQAR